MFIFEEWNIIICFLFFSWKVHRKAQETEQCEEIFQAAVKKFRESHEVIYGLYNYLRRTGDEVYVPPASGFALWLCVVINQRSMVADTSILCPCPCLRVWTINLWFCIGVGGVPVGKNQERGWCRCSWDSTAQLAVPPEGHAPLSHFKVHWTTIIDDWFLSIIDGYVIDGFLRFSCPDTLKMSSNTGRLSEGVWCSKGFCRHTQSGLIFGMFTSLRRSRREKLGLHGTFMIVLWVEIFSCIEAVAEGGHGDGYIEAYCFRFMDPLAWLIFSLEINMQTYFTWWCLTRSLSSKVYRI